MPKINKILAKKPVLSRNLSFSYCDHRRPSWKLLSNASPRFPVPKQPQISIIDVNELSLNRLEYSPYQPILIAKAPLNENNPTPNISTNRSILPQKVLRHSLWSTFFLADNKLVKPFNNNVPLNSVALKEIFCLRKEAYMTFPPKVIDSTIRQAIYHFRVNINNAVKHIEYISCCCSQFVVFL